MAEVGQAVVVVTADTAALKAGFAQAQASTHSFSSTMGKTLTSIGSSFQRVGRSWTTHLSIPLAAGGVAATKMALDFNKAFVQIQTLASKGGMSITQMKTQVEALAKSTGQDPTGLANALYQVLSAGKTAASQAFPILQNAAKGAALGMGDATDVAKVLVTTMNAYGPKVISAGKAMDILTQATHDSAAEADALAQSIGPVIGVAAQVGISFKEVAAGIANATNLGISAARAATGYRFLIQSLAAPTDAAKTALDHYGISAQQLNHMLAQDGLQGTLQELAKTFNLDSVKGQEAWRAVVGGARGAVVANTAVGKSAKSANEELTSLGNSAGITQKKFELWGTTVTGKTAKALSDLKVSAIKLGESLIPILERDIIPALQKVVHWWDSMSQSSRDTFVKWAIAAAAGGPILSLVGGILKIAGGLFKMYTWLKRIKTLGSISSLLGGGGGGIVGGAEGAGAAVGTGWAAGFIKAVSAAAPAAAVAVAAYFTLGANTSHTPQFKTNADALKKLTGLTNTYLGSIQRGTPMYKNAAEAAKFINMELERQGSDLRVDNKILEFAIQHNTSYANALNRVGSAQQKVGQVTHQYTTDLNTLLNATFTNSKAQTDWQGRLQQSTTLTQKSSLAIATSINRFYSLGGSLSAAKKSALEYAIANGNVTKAENILQNALNQSTHSHQNLTKAQYDTRQEAYALSRANQGLTGDEKKSGDQADHTKGQIHDLGVAIGIVAKQKIDVPVSESGTDQTKAKIEGMIQSLGHDQVRVEVSPGKFKMHSGGPVGGTGRGDVVPAMLEPGEFVVRRSVVQQDGVFPALQKLNAGDTRRGDHSPGMSRTFIRGFATGGMVGTPDVNMQFQKAAFMAVIKKIADSLGGATGVVQAAASQIGVPYVWGASNPLGPEGGAGAAFDCSGLTMWAAKKGAGVSLPHNSAMQFATLPHGSSAPGNLVFFGSPVHHVGVVSAPGEMIDAPHTGASVRREGIWGGVAGYGAIHSQLDGGGISYRAGMANIGRAAIPEAHIPLNDKRATRALQKAVGGNSPNINLTIHTNASDPQTVAKTVSRELVKLMHAEGAFVGED